MDTQVINPSVRWVLLAPKSRVHRHMDFVIGVLNLLIIPILLGSFSLVELPKMVVSAEN